MKRSPFDMKFFKFFFGHMNAFCVDIPVYLRFNLQSLPCGCCGNKVNDHFMANWLPSPIHADIAKHPMLNFIPFAGSGRKMAYRNIKSSLVGKLLQRYLPKTYS